MAEREFEFGKVIPASEAEQEYIFDPEIRDLLASGDAIQGFPTSMVSDRVGLPTALARGAADLFDTSRREVVMPAARELGDAIEAYNPETFGFDERIEERLRPGVFMRPEEATSGPEARANMPLARGVSQAVDFAGDLIRSPETRAQAIETLRTVPETLAEQTKLSGIASLRGERVIDPETGMTGMPYDAFLSATTPLAVGRAVSDVPRASFGIFGSGSGKSGKQAEDTVSMLEDSGLDPSEGWERQDGANTYKAYRSSLDGKVRYEIPTANVAFRGVFRETEDPDVELGKLLDPETRDQQRLEAMQGLRIRKNSINDKDYIHVPGFFELDEKQLNKYGFTKLDSKVGKDGLTKFPAPVLEQIVDFPELFDEYPQLRSIQIKPTPSLALFVKGSYNPDTKEISLASVPNTAEGRKEMMSTLLHEVQHAVQDIEGLYGGANTRMFEPTGFAERQTKNQNARKEVDKEIGDGLDNLVVTLDDPGSKKPKTGLFGKIFGLSSPTLPPRTQTGLAGADEERVRFVKRATIGYLRARAEEEEQLAAGELTVGERSRRELEDAIARRQQQLRDLGASEDEIADVEAEYRGQAFRYGGSDREMIYLADELKKAGVKNPEKVAERIGDAFDDQIQKLRPILKEKEQIEEINSRSYEMYEGNPGEVEARNVQRRFEGIEEGEYLRAPSGQLRPFPEKVTPVEMQTLDPEITQGMVLPEGGLVYSLAEGRKGQPSFSIDDPNDPQMDLPGMGPPKPVPTEDPAANLLSMRDGMIGALREDELGSRKRSEIQASLNRVNQRIFRLRQEAGYPTDNLYANGGMVNNMRRRNISGLTNLFSKYNTSGPLAGAGVPRGTMPVGMNQGGNAAARANLTDAQADALGLFDDSRGNPDFGGRPDYSQFDRGDYVRTQTPGMGPAMLNPGFTLSDMQANILAAAAAAQTTQAEPPAAPVVSQPVLEQQPTVPFTPAPTPVPQPDPLVVAPAPVPEPLPPIIQDPLPSPPPMKQRPPPVIDEVQPPGFEPVTPPPMLPPDPDLPPAVYTPPEPTKVTVSTAPMFTPPPIAETPQLPDPVMLSGQTVDFDIADDITPQTGGYATTQGMNIAATGDPFADAVEGQYQMPIYRPQAAGAMPFLSLDFARPRTPSDAPPPPQSENYSTGSYGRLEFAEALANYERMYGPVEDYQAPDTDAVMTDDTTQSTGSATGTGASTVSSGTRFYPEPPPVRGSGGIGPATLYRRQLEAWEAQYGPVEDYYAAQNAAQQNAMNIYLSQQGEEAIAAQYGFTVEQLREINARRRQQGLGPLGELASGINVGM
jgi:hypothetical protein